MSSKDALLEDWDIQKAISPFLKKSRHQAYIWELEELSPLPPEAEFFFLKHEKRRGLSVNPAMDDDFIRPLQGHCKNLNICAIII